MKDEPDVSRETPTPLTPDKAAGVFGSRLPVAEHYCALLAHEGVIRGLIGPREAPRLWERHLVNCALVGEVIEPDLEICDLGSGAGLPGLVLAIARPDLSVTLVEPLLRRTTFLDEAVAELGLTNVEVVRSRAEDLHGKRDFDVVTSRAVAPLRRLLAWSMPLVRQGGSLVAMKGSSAQDEVDAAASELARFGAGVVTISRHGASVIDPQTTVVRVEATLPSQLSWGHSRRQGRKKRR